MAKLLNKVLNLVGLDSEEEYSQDEDLMEEDVRQNYSYGTHNQGLRKQTAGKVVNIHQNNQFKVVVIQPADFEDAQDVCNHLKNKKPIIVNLEGMEKEQAQRIVDFLCGSVYALDGTVQKVSNGIFLLAPNNVDIMGDYKEEFKNKGVFPWIK